jgi:hypothetical protein
MYVDDDDAFEKPTQLKPRHESKHAIQQQQDSDSDWLREDDTMTSWDTLFKKTLQKGKKNTTDRTRRRTTTQRDNLTIHTTACTTASPREETANQRNTPTQSPQPTDNIDQETDVKTDTASERQPTGHDIPTPALTPWNTIYIKRRKGTHPPRLPYPYESNTHDWIGSFDDSQCVLAPPSILTQEDYAKARAHLSGHLATEPIKPSAQPNTQAKSKHPEREHYHRECANKAVTYNIDELLNIHNYTTNQRLHKLRTCKGHGVGIGQSCIPGANRGLFTIKDREDKEYICPYTGTTEPKTERASAHSEYTFHDPRRNMILHGNPATSYGPYANDPLDEHKANCKIRWRKDYQQYWLQAQGPIAGRTEILMMYGHEFWEQSGTLPQELIDKAYPPHLRHYQQPHEDQC